MPTSPSTKAFCSAGSSRALELRQRLFAEPFYRLVHAEADGLPGLICDRYGDVLVLQVNTAGTEALTPALLAALDRLLSPAAIVLRNDSAAREMEGLPAAVEVAKGAVAGPVEVREGGLCFFADVLAGQKTGWFYDQRDSRALVAPLAAAAPCSTSIATPAASRCRRRGPAPERFWASIPPRRRWLWRSGRRRPTTCQPAPSGAPRSSANSSG